MNSLSGRARLGWVGVLLGIIGASALLFPGFGRELFRSNQFLPHATCYLRDPRMIALHVSADLLIGLAYVSISGTLGYLVKKASPDIPFHWMFLAFGLFIITCGFTHFMEVWTVWQPVYWLAGYVKLICAAASLATAIALFPLVPKVFALISAVKTSEERRVKLEIANRELETFASSVSHDLRAPLRAMQGMATALQEDFGPHLPPQAVEYLQEISGASARMDALIRDLLAYSRITRAEAELDQADLNAALREVKTTLVSELTERNAQLEIEQELPLVRANALLLNQALSNLLSNAIKFVPPGTAPRVRVYTQSQGETVRVCIQDNGIGIDPVYNEKIFQIFERLHSTTEYPGTGVGLAIVQKAVERMNGAVGLESVQGQGSCFWIELPRAIGAAN